MMRGYLFCSKEDAAPYSGVLHASGGCKSVILRPLSEAQYMVYFDEAHDGPRSEWPTFAQDGPLYLFADDGSLIPA